VSASFTVPVYQRKAGSAVHLTTVGLGPLTCRASGAGVRKAEDKLLEALKKVVAGAAALDLGRFDLKRGVRLHRVRLEVTLKDAAKRKVTGVYPIVVEPRDAGDERQILLSYHPERPDQWFPADPDEHLGERAGVYFAGVWAGFSDDELRALPTDGKDSLRMVAFSAHTRTLLDELPDRKHDPWDDLALDPARKQTRSRGAMTLLPQIGTNASAELAGQKDADLGLPRKPYRDELLALLGGWPKRSTLVVGPAGAGKSTLVRQAAAGVLDLDGYPVHRNLDRVTAFYRLSGRHLIAGMSRPGTGSSGASTWPATCATATSSCSSPTCTTSRASGARGTPIAPWRTSFADRSPVERSSWSASARRSSSAAWKTRTLRSPPRSFASTFRRRRPTRRSA
jgi:ATP-dependent Clp protease ATP-binding subunit ClpA/ATP-dependent Clp protease ATP-binding subunit ClpC